MLFLKSFVKQNGHMMHFIYATYQFIQPSSELQLLFIISSENIFRMKNEDEK